jgi:hypothetical protein
MIVNIKFFSIDYPCIVQVNYSDGDIGFYQAKNIAHAKSLSGKIVAIFKPKHQSSYTPDPKEPS